MGRSRFEYELLDGCGKSYGITTDMYMLPVGTEFFIVNGAWRGKIVESDGEKYVFVNATKRMYKLREDRDYRVVARIDE